MTSEQFVIQFVWPTLKTQPPWIWPVHLPSRETWIWGATRLIQTLDGVAIYLNITANKQYRWYGHVTQTVTCWEVTWQMQQVKCNHKVHCQQKWPPHSNFVWKLEVTFSDFKHLCCSRGAFFLGRSNTNDRTLAGCKPTKYTMQKLPLTDKQIYKSTEKI